MTMHHDQSIEGDFVRALEARDAAHRARRRDILSLPPGQIGAGVSTLLSAECWLLGWSLFANGAAAFAATIFDGDDGTGNPLAQLSVPVGQSSNVAMPAEGIRCRMGLTIIVTAGTATGGLLARPAR